MFQRFVSFFFRSCFGELVAKGFIKEVSIISDSSSSIAANSLPQLWHRVSLGATATPHDGQNVFTPSTASDCEFNSFILRVQSFLQFVAHNGFELFGDFERGHILFFDEHFFAGSRIVGNAFIFLRTLNVPKPLISMRSPDLSDSIIVCMNPSTTVSVSCLVKPERVAIIPTMSAFVTVLLKD